MGDKVEGRTRISVYLFVAFLSGQITSIGYRGGFHGFPRDSSTHNDAWHNNRQIDGPVTHAEFEEPRNLTVVGNSVYLIDNRRNLRKIFWQGKPFPTCTLLLKTQPTSVWY